MNKTLLWIGSLLWLLMLGTAEANDLNTYRYITEDGTALNITDTAYTRVAESTIAGKRYWIALHSENKADDRDTMIIKGKTNIHVTHISDFKITKITPDPDDATGKITEMEQMLPRQLFSRMKFTGASGTIGGKTWHLPQQRCKTMLLNNAIHIQASDGDTSLDLAKAGSLSGELHDQSSCRPMIGHGGHNTQCNIYKTPIRA